MPDASVSARGRDTRPIFRLSLPTWLLLGVALGASMLTVNTGVAEMIGRLLTPQYSHGLAIPFVAAFFAWQRRDQIERIPFRGSWAGLALALLGAALGVIGKLSTVFAIEHYSVIVMLSGLLLALTGWRVFRLLLVPLLILFLMVPLPDFLYQNFSVQLQLLSSRIGVAFIRFVGIPVYLEGNVIDLGAYKLQVAEACDGLRYLFPLMTLGFVGAYFFKAALWKRAALFLSSIPISILMNSFRIGTIGMMVNRWGIGMAEGFLHGFQGWVVFMASGAILVLEIMLLSRLGAEDARWRELFGVEFPAPPPMTPAPVIRPVPASFYVTAAVLLVASGVSLSLPDRTEAVPPRTPFAQFPSRIGVWSGWRATLEDSYRRELMLDDYYLASFSQGDQPPVNIYVAWYNSQRAGHSVHSPRSCLPGGGWTVESFTQRVLPDVRAGHEVLRVNRVGIQLGAKRALVYYWFQQRGRVITNEYAAKWFLFWDALTRNRSDGALVRLVVTVPAGGTPDAADATLTAFATAATTTLTAYIPN
jgi:exosortase D (VPLPA-CTERM-specific)